MEPSSASSPHSPAPLPESAPAHGPGGASSKVMFGLALGALGVVYGDIGTSPLYALRICFSAVSGVAVGEANILGVVSLILWALILLISVKYLALVLRADNRGEGGILALMALVHREKVGLRWPLVIVFMGLFGASLLYGDGLITPAISVLSAMEGLNVGTPFFEPYIVMMSLVILIGLFWMQRRGTQTVGTIFGPVMLLWFVVLGVLGVVQICHNPAILSALNPLYAVEFFVLNKWQAFVTLGAVFLAVTGGEALYADMGHFGAGPIRIGWYTLVMPALLLNYLGQGAWLLGEVKLGYQGPALVENLFYRIVPEWALYPMVILATAATVIASQAIISGAFSLTRQAVQLGYCPRMTIIHTSKETIGQVYLPVVNWIMLGGTVLLVLGFKKSDNLAGAYGVAVSLIMLITTILMFLVMRRLWNWSFAAAVGVCLPFLLVDLTFFGANLPKVTEGGWVPLSIALAAIVIMTTWQRGRDLLNRKLVEAAVGTKDFLNNVAEMKPHRVSGVAAFLTGNPDGIPRTLLHNFKHNKIIHEQVVLLTVRTEDIPRVSEAERVQVKVLTQGFYQILLRYGFSEDPDIPAALRNIRQEGLDLDPMRVTFFLGRETLILGREHNMRPWRKHLFSFLSKNARDASKFFRIPPNRVIEVGIQVEL